MKDTANLRTFLEAFEAFAQAYILSIPGAEWFMHRPLWLALAY